MPIDASRPRALRSAAPFAATLLLGTALGLAPAGASEPVFEITLDDAGPAAAPSPAVPVPPEGLDTRATDAIGPNERVAPEDLVYLLEESGYRTGIDLDRLILAAERMQGVLGRELPGQVMKAGPRLRRYGEGAVPTAAGR